MKQKRPGGPRDFQGLLNAAIGQHQAGQAGAAILGYRSALRLRPNHAEAHNYLAHALRSAGRPEEAVEHYQRAIALKANYGNAHYNLSVTLSELGRTAEAEEQLRIARSFERDPAKIQHNLGTELANGGRFEEARAHLEQAIKLNPEHLPSHLGRALITRFRAGDPALEELEKLAARANSSAAETAFVYFSLAKALEDTGDFESAFRYYQKGNRLQRSNVLYDEKQILGSFRRTARSFSTDLLREFEGAGDPSTTPIFVLGMPRSGSTLVEQILSSHPRVHGAGELMTLEAVARGFPLASLTSDSTKPDSLNREWFGKAARRYLDLLPESHHDTLRIVDKMPANFFHVGLIHLLFPNAKIIHTMRDPLDTCVSCYTTPFSIGNPFAWDQGELGRYYAAYAELMEHWRSVLPPGRMLDVSYEKVIDDLEGQSRQMIEYCGLQWDDRCLRFNENPRRVNTASFVQVRSPLFRSSVGRWRRFESELGLLMRELKRVTLQEKSALGAGGI